MNDPAIRKWLLPALILAFAAACRPDPVPPHEAPSRLQLTSAAFPPDGLIPELYTCLGHGTSPPLAWNDPPEATRSMLLVLEKPGAAQAEEARDELLWVVYNLPPAVTRLPEGFNHRQRTAGWDVRPGAEPDASRYDGPCPSTGETGRYVFRIYALDRVLEAEIPAVAADVRRIVDGHVLAEGEVAGIFGYATR